MLPDAEPLQAQTELLAGPRNDLEKALIATWTQFLEVKHGLKITPEDLTTTFLSHYIYMRKYR